MNGIYSTLNGSSGYRSNSSYKAGLTVRGDPAFSFFCFSIRQRMISSFCDVKFSFALAVSQSFNSFGSLKVRLDLLSVFIYSSF